MWPILQQAQTSEMGFTATPDRLRGARGQLKYLNSTRAKTHRPTSPLAIRVLISEMFAQYAQHPSQRFRRAPQQLIPNRKGPKIFRAEP